MYSTESRDLGVHTHAMARYQQGISTYPFVLVDIMCNYVGERVAAVVSNNTAAVNSVNLPADDFEYIQINNQNRKHIKWSKLKYACLWQSHGGAPGNDSK